MQDQNCHKNMLAKPYKKQFIKQYLYLYYIS